MRLIDADNLRKDIENLCPEFGNEDSSFVEQGEVLDFIEEQPTVDAVQVVRCRDCKHYKRGEVLCEELCWVEKTVSGNKYLRRPDDFCSRGERRDNDG